MCLVVVGHPLDLIKVKLQTGGQYKGIADAAAKTLRAEGVRYIDGCLVGALTISRRLVIGWLGITIRCVLLAQEVSVFESDYQ